MENISRSIDRNLDQEVTKAFERLENKKLIEGLLKAAIKLASSTHPEYLDVLNEALGKVLHE